MKHLLITIAAVLLMACATKPGEELKAESK